MENITFNLTSLMAIAGSVITPFLLKLLKSKTYREQFLRAVKLIFNGFLGRANLNHYLFNNSRYYKGMAKGITFDGCPIKTKLFYTLLELKIDAVITESLAFISNNRKKLKRMNKLELRGELSSLVSNVVSKYEEEIPAKYYIHLENREKANKAWDLIYNGNGTHMGFKEYHAPNLKPIIKYIDNVPLYSTSTNEQLVYHLFGLFDTALLTAIQDLRESFETINGDLKHL